MASLVSTSTGLTGPRTRAAPFTGSQELLESV